MIKNYKACREKAEHLGKIFILKNNQPDAVLFSIIEYERISAIIEYLESLSEKDFVKAVASLPKQGNTRSDSIDDFRTDQEATLSTISDDFRTDQEVTLSTISEMI